MSEIIKEDSDLRIAKAEQGMLMHTVPELEKQLKRLNELLEFYLTEAYGYPKHYKDET